MPTFKLEYKIRNRDVDINKELKLSRLLEMFQEISITHTQNLGAGREKTLDKGFLWVIIQQDVHIYKLPEYDDELILESSPGKTMHVLFPRYYRLKDKEGNLLVKGSALWALIDANTRKLVFPDKHNIEISGEEDPDIDLPSVIPTLETLNSREYEVLYSYCDLNGHMNNTVYFDLAENIIKKENPDFNYTHLQSEFKHEIPYKSLFTVNWINKDNQYYFLGNNENICFKIMFS